MELHKQFITKADKIEFVVLPYQEFIELQEHLEDLEDLLELRKAKKSDKDDPSIPFEDAVKQLSK